MPSAAGEGPDAARIVISGAGPVGAALALGLAQTGWAVTLIESRRLGEGRGDRRRFVLSDLSAQWLARIGVWGALAGGTQVLHSIRVEEPGCPPVDFEARAIDLPTFGYAVDAGVLAQAFAAAIRGEPRIRLLEGVHIEQVTRTGITSHLEIARDDGKAIGLATRLLVIAEGQIPPWLAACGLRIRTRPSGRVALVIRLRGLPPLRPDRVLERLGPDGLLALLPESPDRATLTWTLPQDAAERFLAQPQPSQREEVARLLGWPSETLDWSEDPGCFDLIRHAVTPPYQAGLLVIGQAAHRVAPFAAQGMNLSWRDTRSLIEALAQADQAESDFSTAEWLASWWQTRRHDHRRVEHLTEDLPLLFAPRAQPARWVRRAGWHLLRHAPPLRRSILRYGLGWNP